MIFCQQQIMGDEQQVLPITRDQRNGRMRDNKSRPQQATNNQQKSRFYTEFSGIFIKKINRMKLLIVEDNIKLLDAITDTLQAEKFKCERAAGYLDAQEKLFVYDYDIALIDINLPDGSGLELIRELKKQNRNMGIIVVSARNATIQKIEGLNLGADDYLTKPFDMAELVARVKALLRRRNFGGSDTISIGDLVL